MCLFFFSSRRRHTRCALVTGVQTCALPIFSFGTEQVRSSRAGERLIPCYHPTTRHLGNLLRNTVLAWRTVRTERPAAIVSTGAAVAVPFMLPGRLLRVPTEYLYVYDRVDSTPMSGRYCHRIVDLFLVHLPYPQALTPARTTDC